jgi:hypothetical protein
MSAVLAAPIVETFDGAVAKRTQFPSPLQTHRPRVRLSKFRGQNLKSLKGRE